MRSKSILVFLSLSLILLSSACLPETPESAPIETPHSTPVASPTSEANQQLPTPLVANGEANPLPPDPLDMVFFSMDGAELKGRFYPAATLGQPVVIFMHWYQGDQDDWEEIAYWLQNRGVSGNRAGAPWLDSSWFPSLPHSTSFNALTFTFRNCEGGCSQPSPDEWLWDARASLEAARSLQGVDPDRIITIGASIGGDAAISSCASALVKDPEACLGALSFSPGNYLSESYPDLVTLLGNLATPRPAWCLYDQTDPDAVVCQKADGPHYRSEGWQGGNLHGMHLITSTLDPLPLSRLLDFLILVSDN